MSTPYIGFGNATLRKLPRVAEGDEIHCPHCNGYHVLETSKDERGEPSTLLMFYQCGDKMYLGAIEGRLVAHSKPDVSGKIA